MTTNLAEARSLSRRDRRPSRTRDRTAATERDRSRHRTNRAPAGEDPEPDQTSRLDSRRARHSTVHNQDPADRARALPSRRHSRGRSKSESVSTDDEARDGRQNSTRARKSFDLTVERPLGGARGYAREDRQTRGEDLHKPHDHTIPKHSSHNAAVSASFSRTGVEAHIRGDRAPSFANATADVSRAIANPAQSDVKLSHRKMEEPPPELERPHATDGSKSRREIRERCKIAEAARGGSASQIQASQCLVEADNEVDQLKEVASTIVQNKQEQYKKLAEQEQARKLTERAAIRERRRLERERLEREREAAEAAAAAERAIIAQKAACAAEKLTKETTRPAESVDDSQTTTTQTSKEPPKPSPSAPDRNAESTPTAPSSGERRETISVKSRSVPRKKTPEHGPEDEPPKPCQTPRRTLVVRDANIPPDTSEDDRVILVSGIDDEGARAKKPSDYKKEASTGLIRKRSITTQAAVEFASPRQATSRAKSDKPTASPFRPCPGFAGVEGTNELMKALAFRRQKTMGTEKEYHATGNNSSLAIDDHVVKTGSADGDDDEEDSDSYSVG